MSYQAIYHQKRRSAREALSLIKDGDAIFVAQVASAPMVILEELTVLKDFGIKDTVMVSCLPVGYFQAMDDPEMIGICRQESWFFSPQQRAAHEKQLAFCVPQHSTSALWKKVDRARHEGRRLVLLGTCSPMDKHGYVSLSLSTIYEKELIEQGALAILEINPNYPRTFGDTLVHVSQVAALVESDRPVPEIELSPYTDIDAAIGHSVAELIEDGSTIQLGIGNIPNAIAHALKDKKHLGIHTEMFTENMLDLLEAGAVDNSQKGFYDGFSLCSFAFGSRRLYDYLDDNPSVLFKRVTIANDPYQISRNNRFVSVNAALEIDLSGQCASESIGHKQYSGTGGQVDTVQGAQRSKDGKSIIALHSTYTKTDKTGREVRYSKIVPELTPGAIVSLQRNDTDYVVTEYGVAWLRGLNVAERVKELIRIAHPDFRDWLKEEAQRNGLI